MAKGTQKKTQVSKNNVGGQDYSNIYICGALALCGALYFAGNISPIDQPATITETQSQTPIKTKKKRGLGAGTEFYAPWFNDASKWAVSDEEWLSGVNNSSDVFAACDLENILSEVPSPGFHVLCTMPITQAESKLSSTRIAVFKRGIRASNAHTSFLIPKEITDNGDMAALVNFVDARLGTIKKPDRYQRMAFFSPRGRRLQDTTNIFKRSQVLAFEGGQWIWPGVKIGHTVQLPGLRRKNEVTEIVTVALQPKIFEIKNFLKTSEADHIIEKAGPHVAKSAVSVKDVDKEKAQDGVDQWRTSLTHFYSSYHDKVMQKVEKRVQSLTRVNISHAEDTQVLRYDVNGRYLSHHDFFDPKDYKGANEQKMIHQGAKNRMATVFFYLNTVSEGGETGFPRAGGLPQPNSFDRCDIGYRSKPEKNKVIIFYSMHPDGSLDVHSLHGGCPVKKGEKWSANFWIWNKAYPVGGPGRDGPGKTKVSHMDPLEYEDVSLDPEADQKII